MNNIAPRPLPTKDMQTIILYENIYYIGTIIMLPNTNPANTYEPKLPISALFRLSSSLTSLTAAGNAPWSKLLSKLQKKRKTHITRTALLL